MSLQKVSQKNLKTYFLVAILKVTDEKSRIRSRIRIRLSEVRIRTEMSRIRNTGFG
jgi:hypothetical protein